MNRDSFHGLWMQFSGQVKEQWGTLMHDQLTVAAGTRDQIAGRMQKQRGLLKQAANLQLEDFISRNRNWRDTSKH
jgi:uncharacterized protein YjbJ (UPF0337 family)